METSTNELNSIAGQIKAAKVQVQLLERVSHLHVILENLKKLSVEDVIPYAEAISEAENILNDAEDRIDTELEIWSSVLFEIERNKDLLLKHLEDSWNTEIQWIKKESLTLKLSSDKKREVFQALSTLGQLDRPLSDWSARLLEEVLVPLTKADTLLRIEENLEIADGERPVVELVELETVVKNIINTFHHLTAHFAFKLNGTWVLELVGRQIADEFTKVFIKNCLKPTLPASSSLLSSPEYTSALEK